MRKAFLLAVVSLIVFTGTAMADTLNGRFGIYGKAGAIVPLQDDFVTGASGAGAAFATGGGLIFGIGNNFAAEIDVTHAPTIDVDYGGAKTYEAKYTDIAVGLQYRFASRNRVVPYVGLGPDFIRGHLKYVGSGSGGSYNLDWTYGGHVNLGADFFITRGIAFNLDLRGIFAAKGDVTTEVGAREWNPNSFVGTAGIRLILPEIAAW